MSINISYKGYNLKFDKEPSSEEILEEYESKVKLSNNKDRNQVDENNISYYPLTSSQNAIWLSTQKYNKNSLYNIPFAIQFDGKLDYKALNFALNSILKKHSILNVVIRNKNGLPMQYIKEPQHIDLHPIYITSDKEKLKKIYYKQLNQGFDLKNGPLYKMVLLKHDQEHHILLCIIHHIVFDGPSVEIFINELNSYYKQFIDTNEHSVDLLDQEYLKLAKSERFIHQEDNLTEAKMYWKEKLSGDIPTLELPFKRNINISSTIENKSVTISLSDQTKVALQKLSQKNRTTLFITLTTVVNLLLYRYTNENNIIIGTPVTTRLTQNRRNSMGCFINMIALKNNLSGNPKFEELLSRVKETTLEAYQYANFPLQGVLDTVGAMRNLSYNPLFQVVISYQKNPFISLNDKDLSIKSLDCPNQTSEYFLLLDIIENSKSIDINFQYRSDIFDENTIKSMTMHLHNIINNILDKPEQNINDIELMSPTEKKSVLGLLDNIQSNKKVHYNCIQDLIEEQVKKHPNNIAIKFIDNYMTYSELNSKSNQLARLLRKKGVKQNVLVGIMVNCSSDMLVGILAILKAGGAYLPISPFYPEERINYILQDSRISLMLTEEQLINKKSFDIELINLNDKNIYLGESSDLKNINSKSDLAYVIYTSGSTGKPKGVMVEHHSVINAFEWINNKYDFNENDVFIQNTSFTFDVSVWELFLWNLVGARVILLSEGQEKSPREILQSIIENRVTILFLVPTMLNSILDYILKYNLNDSITSIRQIFSTGEALTSSLVKKFNKIFPKESNVKLTNLYGPTETTIDVTYYNCLTNNEIEETENIPIGKPIDNTSLYVVDNNNHLQPIGVNGELCISGDCLSRGYLFNKQLTNEKFVSNPFRLNSIMYKTGDKARLLNNGNILLLGRLDNQVKIKGFRIELEEIESILNKHSMISKCKVITKQYTEQNKQLVAYVVLNEEYLSNNKADNAPLILKEYLKKYLPIYMIPAYIITLSKLPTTFSGKIDTNYLKNLEDDIDFINQKNEIKPPKTKFEKILSKILCEYLGLKQIDISDNFFNLGGDSLRAIQVIGKLNEIGYDIKIQDFFKCNTIEELSKNIIFFEELNDEFISSEQQNILNKIEKGDINV